MARTHFVKCARKDNPAAGVKKGESYYWWKFRRGAKHFSKTPPKQSQLTGSEFLSQALNLNELLAELDCENIEMLKDEIQDIAEQFRELGSDCEDKRSNMPDQLQDCETGEKLGDRASACEDVADELEAVDCEVDEDDLHEEAKAEVVEDHASDEPKPSEEDLKDDIEERFQEKLREKLAELLEEVHAIQYRGE